MSAAVSLKEQRGFFNGATIVEAISLSAGLLTFVFCFWTLDIDAMPSLVPSFGATFSLWLGHRVALLFGRSNPNEIRPTSGASERAVHQARSLAAPRRAGAPSGAVGISPRNAAAR
jgi:hypothetical protein